MIDLNGGTRRNTALLVAIVGGWAAAIVFVATRRGVVLSPDSITYLSVADKLASGDGFADFTGQPMAIFGPVYPLLLAPGGTGLGWARGIGAVAMSIVAVGYFFLLRRRVGPTVALIAALLIGLSGGLVAVAGHVYSEAPFVAVSVVMLNVLVARERATPVVGTRLAIICGVLAGGGFLVRYAGANLLIVGSLVMIAPLLLGRGAIAAGHRRHQLRDVAGFLIAAGLTISPWLIRNLVISAEALGPRFSGGISESMSVTLKRPLQAVGETILGRGQGTALAITVGSLLSAIYVLVAVGSLLRVRQGRSATIELALALYGLTSIVLPVLARRATANDIESRVMSPVVMPIVGLGAIAGNLLWQRRMHVVARLGAVAVLAVSVWWAFHGARVIAEFPDRLPGSSASRQLHSSALHDAVDLLPTDALILTNNPQRVWWQSRRDPVLFAFTRPRPGNSHYPLDAVETLRRACTSKAYLVWFDGLLNAGEGFEERRPDLLEVVSLTSVSTTPGGQILQLHPLASEKCSR